MTPKQINRNLFDIFRSMKTINRNLQRQNNTKTQLLGIALETAEMIRPAVI